MLSHTKILLLVALPCVIFGLRVEAVAQAGRLGGTVAYAAPNARPVVARGVRVIAVGGYSQTETRTDNNGNFVLVLRPGEYRVVAQGAAPYVQYQEVKGNVRANTDSYINPNPLFLVPQNRRSSGNASAAPSSQMPALSELAILAYVTVAENNDSRNTGGLSGSVMIKQGNQPAIAARNVIVWAVGGRGKRSVWTNQNGDFLINSLPVGEYNIYVSAPNYPRYQREVMGKGSVESGRVSQVSPNPILLVQK